MHSMGFSKDFLTWMTSYLTGRQQYVMIDDKCSQRLETCFGVSQGSILGLLIFNERNMIEHVVCPARDAHRHTLELLRQPQLTAEA